MSEDKLVEPSRVCVECGKPVGPGRKDKKFCHDSCRTAYNNRRREQLLKAPAEAYTTKPAFQKVFDILINNRNLLEMHDLFVDQPYLLRDLLGQGFNPKYFTSEYTLKGGELFKFCFDFGYHTTTDGRVYILERPEEIFC